MDDKEPEVTVLGSVKGPAGFFATLDKVLKDKRCYVPGVLVVQSNKAKQLTSLQLMPSCFAPITEDQEMNYATWPTEMTQWWAAELPKLEDWWAQRLALSRVARLPVCSMAGTWQCDHEALDALYGRRLRAANCVLWASERARPDVGDEAVEADVVHVGRTNAPGAYWSVVYEVQLPALCVAAVRRANMDRVGGHSSTVGKPALRALRDLADHLDKEGHALGAQLQNETDPARKDALAREQRALGHLVNNFYGWVASPGSLLQDPALLHAVESEMRDMQRELLQDLKRNGCEVIFADLTRVLFATGKHSLEQAEQVWQTLVEGFGVDERFKALKVHDDHILKRWCGLVWLDAVNYAGVPVADGKVAEPVYIEYSLNLVDQLPAAVRMLFYNKALGKWIVQTMKYVLQHPGDDVKKALAEFHKNFLPGYGKGLFNVVTKIQESLDKDMAQLADRKEEALAMGTKEAVESVQKYQEKLSAKWDLPDMPGVIEKESCGSVTLQFVKVLYEFLRVERDAQFQDKVRKLRRDLLQLVHEREFDPRCEFKCTNTPVEVQVACPTCALVEVVDVTTHDFLAPGLWQCRSCNATYGREHLEALLLEIVDEQVVRWQTQEIVCKKCGQTRHDLLAQFCHCAGQFVSTIDGAAVKRHLQAVLSVAQPHHFVDLEQRVSMYLSLM